MANKKILTEEDDALLAELGIEVEFKKHATFNSREERIIAGFEEIKKFVQDNGRLPEHGEDKEIFERLFAIRLDQIRGSEESKTLLQKFDDKGLLADNFQPVLDETDDLDDDELLAQLGVDETEENSITNLKHVRSQAEKKAAEEIANRAICEDFERFKPMFDEVKNDISLKYRSTIRFRKDAGFTKTTIRKGQFLIIVGQIAYIDDIGETIKAPNGEDDARLRVIYDNGTESNILLRSLIRAMYKDDTSRFITDPNSGPLFSGESSEDDLESGTIYVLRSLSDHPLVKANKSLVHKIGVTGGDVKKRITNAKNDPTFLMADVEVIATYKLANINRVKLEKVIHRFFSNSKLEVEINDRFGKPVKANEWFLMPLFIIDQMVDKIKDGTVSDFYYDPSSAELKRH
ncbi:GIY-YIG nuclease family protein [Mucilaginibacter defluvii]|uniref:GIY-YIG nuclease family protein n=1 Tax=Mucilaginibacter defluvii TaxID=1196019 RepID=A0ABP9FUE1_9SPHI